MVGAEVTETEGRVWWRGLGIGSCTSRWRGRRFRSTKIGLVQRAEEGSALSRKGAICYLVVGPYCKLEDGGMHGCLG